MDKRSPPTLAEQVAAAQDWWREAGVDSDFTDAPHNWLEKPPEPAADAAVPAAAPARPPEPQVPPLGGPASSWPRTLADFGPWWLASEELETGGTAPRVAPRGVGQAELMVLVPMPEEDDRELLSGTQGKLIGNMLSAMGIAADAAYLAPALPRRARHPDWNALAARDLGKVLTHHVNLAAPKRLLVLGRAMLPLFGHDPAQAGAKPRRIALEGSRVSTLVSYGPENLLETGRFRAALWRGWLEWTGGDE